MVPNDARAEDIPHQTAWCRHCAGLIRYWPPQHAWRHVRLGLAESAGHPPEPLPAPPPPDPTPTELDAADVLSAARRVVIEAETDDNWDGEYIAFVVPAEALDALRAALALIPEGSVLVTEETLAAALISSDLIPRYAEYAQDAHEWTMQREGHEVLGDQWAAAILARIREGQQPERGAGHAFERVTSSPTDEMTPDEEAASIRNGGVDNKGRYAQNPAAARAGLPDDEPCPECGVEDAAYSEHEDDCPSGYPRKSDTRQVLVRQYSGGVMFDGTTNHPPLDFARAAQNPAAVAPVTESEARLLDGNR
jgi:hypothetical protein